MKKRSATGKRKMDEFELSLLRERRVYRLGEENWPITLQREATRGRYVLECVIEDYRRFLRSKEKKKK